MKYCLNITYHMFKIGSMRLKLLNVSAITATTWCIVAYFSKSVKIFVLRPLLKVLVLVVCWLCNLSVILDVPLLFNFMSVTQVLLKLLLIGTLVDVWHQTVTSLQILEKGPSACLGSAHTSCLSSWTPAKHSVTDGSYLSACDKHLKTAFLATAIVLC